jgi:hypothetical protein
VANGKGALRSHCNGPKIENQAHPPDKREMGDGKEGTKSINNSNHYSTEEKRIFISERKRQKANPSGPTKLLTHNNHKYFFSNN